MTDAAVEQRLSELPGWQYQDKTLVKTFTFKDFAAAFNFMKAVAPIADKMNHHPDWSNSYNKVTVHLTSHDAGGVTDQDFVLANEMEMST